MNKKKVLGAVLTMACAVNFSMAAPAQAFSLVFPGTAPSASQQEKWAQDNIRDEFKEEGPISNSDLAKAGTPIVHRLQKRICDANGIEVTTQQYQHASDHKHKVHPILVVDNGSNNAISYGAGYISVPANSTWIRHITKEQSNQYDAFDLEQTIAHELSHNIKGEFGSLLAPGTTEKQAEFDSVKLLDPLPEGGWGVYLISNRRGNGYLKIQEKVRKSFEKETKGKIEIKDNGATVIYHYGKKGGWGQLLTSLYTGREDVQDENAYFGGQLAYCIAKGGLTVDGIDIMENNLKQDLKFQGDYLLVCRSNKYPNGYRILAPLYGKDRKKLEGILNYEREQVVTNKAHIDMFSGICEVLLQKYNEHDFWVAWLACAVAQKESE